MENLFAKLKNGLRKTRDTMLGGIFSQEGRVNEEFYEELEEAMIVADMGMDTTQELITALRDAVDQAKIKEVTAAREQLAQLIRAAMEPETPLALAEDGAVLLIVGVNGVGKTTSIGKLANFYAAQGRKPMLAAADTFRAAAAEQLTVWAQRADVPIVKHGEGSDPAAVVFDAIASYRAKERDLLIVDTAGRLHNKKNLMEELKKIRRVIDRELPGAALEVLLVLDATTGQNAIAQARTFGETAGLTGVVLTKLDGTAKGGMAVCIKRELGLPVRFIGVGEGMEDLQPFDADSFARALLGCENP